MKQIAIIFILFFYISKTNAQSHFKIRNDAFIQIGASTYKLLTFGATETIPFNPSLPNNGSWALEHCPNCIVKGFNIARPWPNGHSGNYYLFIRDINGNVGIGNSGDNSAKLFVSGSIKASSFITVSDERFKENFKPIGSSLDKICALNLYQYN